MTAPQPRKKKPARPFRAVAEAIARELFTEYEGKRAARLAMKHTNGIVECEGSGWSERALADRIEDNLTRALQPLQP